MTRPFWKVDRPFVTAAAGKGCAVAAHRIWRIEMPFLPKEAGRIQQNNNISVT
jgi:hypothetical protein